VDELLTMAFVDDEETGEQFRALITDVNNPWGYPAKDRSTRLAPLEKPDLGRILTKINGVQRTEQKPATKPKSKVTK
jgi:hypothetical protein